MEGDEMSVTEIGVVEEDMANEPAGDGGGKGGNGLGFGKKGWWRRWRRRLRLRRKHRLYVLRGMGAVFA